MEKYTVALDVMGGDYGPEAAIPAAFMALERYSNLSVILVGDETLIERYLTVIPHLKTDRYRIHHASQWIEMDESPVTALRHKVDSSMRVALELVKDGVADACISAGNTGALVAIARFVLKMIPGINRPAMSALLPTHSPLKGVRLLDLGANVDVKVEHLLQFAMMGLVLSNEIDRVAHPQLALLNIGSETGKGNIQVQKAGKLFAHYSQPLNYVGYLEGSELFQGKVDVVVCDGFTGNVSLKIMEGVSNFIYHNVESAFRQSWFSRLAGWVAQPVLRDTRHRFNPNRYNGASLIGLQGVVIKSHGNADAHAFSYAFQYAIAEIEKKVPQQLQERLTTFLNHASTP